MSRGGLMLFKLCGSFRANRFNRIASALESEGAKQFQIGHYFNPTRGAETSHFFSEKISISEHIQVPRTYKTGRRYARWRSGCTAKSEAQGGADFLHSLGAEHCHTTAQMGLRHGDDMVQINRARALHSVRFGQADLRRHTPDGGSDRGHRDGG
jgi:hypothetical protein